MVALAVLIWLLATVVLAVPVSLALRSLDTDDVEDLVDPVELDDAMRRHPSQRPKVA